MGRSKKKVLCIFCDKKGDRSVEDIIPTWLAKELGGTSPFYTDYADFAFGQEPRIRKDRKSGSFAILKLPPVCVRCNGRWMSDLEKKTKWKLIPLIRGTSCKLTDAECRQVAAWAHLKAVSLDAHYRATRHLPGVLAHLFCKSHQPLGEALVAVGRFDPPSPGKLLRFGRSPMTMVSHRGRQVNLVRVSWAFNHLYLQTTLTAGLRGGDDPIPIQIDSRLTVIWPPSSNTISWQTNELIRPDEFDSMASDHSPTT